ncbi:synaptic vesicle 2-related protein [Trichonephila clavata]|uniref:Synaptic vesicle 2-related protein n=1 Tax=Trichonephila clavata TaxID=2740835 RepID=A0A8X6FN18_TRICU|nr:synaptic vesicle 2-related protein [Trichonephila clavata]
MTTHSISIPGTIYSVDDAVNQVGYGAFQIRLTLLAGLGWLADSFEIFILSVIGDFLACEWTLYRWQIALLTSIVFAGIMVGSPILGTIADVYGRKRSLVISMVLLFFFGAVSAAAPSYTWMVFFRTCMGFSLGGIAQGVTLNSEYCPTNVRGKTGFYLCYFWSLGSIGVVLLTWVVMEYLNNWRILLALASVPSLIVILSLKRIAKPHLQDCIVIFFSEPNNVFDYLSIPNEVSLRCVTCTSVRQLFRISFVTPS